MCGIVGFYAKNRSRKNVIKLLKLFRNSRIRGKHSYGISFVENGQLRTQKYFQNQFRKIQIPENADALIFHNRYSTSGDFRDENNNQPIQFNDSSLVFNGVLDMASKSEIESKYQIQMQTANDGEILFHQCPGPKEMMNFTKTCGSFSGLLLNQNSLYAWTNGYRPLWYLEDEGTIFIASTKDIFERSILMCNPKPVEVNKLHEWKIG